MNGLTGRLPDLPAGYRLSDFGTVDSTNAEALRQSASGDTGPLWIRAREQTAGRGRRARVWSSPPGNLYATLLITLSGPTTRLTEIGQVAGLAIHDTVSGFLGGHQCKVALKWPNDLLVDGRKISGLLIESVGLRSTGPWSLAVGMGINLASHPADTQWPATDLGRCGATVDPDEALERLAAGFARWLVLWREPDGGAKIREAWADRVAGIGDTIKVTLADETLTGRFAALDDSGALVLDLADGSRRLIMAGDVFMPAARNDAQKENADAGAT